MHHDRSDPNATDQLAAGVAALDRAWPNWWQHHRCDPDRLDMARFHPNQAGTLHLLVLLWGSLDRALGVLRAPTDQRAAWAWLDSHGFTTPTGRYDTCTDQWRQLICARRTTQPAKPTSKRG